MENLRYRKFAIADVKDMAKKGERMVFLNQYENMNNPSAHFNGTAEEILKQMEGRPIDYFIAGMGTGGTITGIGSKLKEKYPNIKIIAVQPVQNQIIEGLRSLKDGFVPTIIDFDLIDEIYDLEAEKAMQTKDELAKKGILVGPSSGAAMYVCREKQRENPGATIVTVFPDRGERYL
jgi:cysteine synthase A